LFFLYYLFYDCNYKEKSIDLLIYYLLISFLDLYLFKTGLGMGIGDWGLGIGDWAQSPIPNPQSPIPNPHPHDLIMSLTKLKI
jgi:hypothetical protein